MTSGKFLYQSIGTNFGAFWTPLGFDWKAGVSLLTGVAAKEVVVSTMAVLYQGEEVMEEDAGANATLERRCGNMVLPRLLPLYL